MQGVAVILGVILGVSLGALLEWLWIKFQAAALVQETESALAYVSREY